MSTPRAAASAWGASSWTRARPSLRAWAWSASCWRSTWRTPTRSASTSAAATSCCGGFPTITRSTRTTTRSCTRKSSRLRRDPRLAALLHDALGARQEDRVERAGKLGGHRVAAAHLGVEADLLHLGVLAGREAVERALEAPALPLREPHGVLGLGLVDLDVRRRDARAELLHVPLLVAQPRGVVAAGQEEEQDAQALAAPAARDGLALLHVRRVARGLRGQQIGVARREEVLDEEAAHGPQEGGLPQAAPGLAREEGVEDEVELLGLVVDGVPVAHALDLGPGPLVELVAHEHRAHPLVEAEAGDGQLIAVEREELDGVHVRSDALEVGPHAGEQPVRGDVEAVHAAPDAARTRVGPLVEAVREERGVPVAAALVDVHRAHVALQLAQQAVAEQALLPAAGEDGVAPRVHLARRALDALLLHDDLRQVVHGLGLEVLGAHVVLGLDEEVRLVAHEA